MPVTLLKILKIEVSINLKAFYFWKIQPKTRITKFYDANFKKEIYFGDVKNNSKPFYLTISSDTLQSFCNFSRCL